MATPYYMTLNGVPFTSPSFDPFVDRDYDIRGTLDLARRNLAVFAASEANRVQAVKLFGDSELLTTVLDQMLVGQFELPEICIVDNSVLPSADGAYLPDIDL